MFHVEQEEGSVFKVPRGTLSIPKVKPKVLVLQPAHNPDFPGRFVLVTAKMKGPVKKDPVEFLFNRHLECGGIFPDPGQADVDFPLQGTFPLRQVETDDICIEIMLQEGLVDFQEIFVVTEYIMDFTQPFSFLFEESGQEFFEFQAVGNKIIPFGIMELYP